MELLWFYVAIVLAISDTIHTQIVWKIFNKFYLILGGIINNSVNAPWKTWIIHELMEAGFHFIFVSIAFLNLEIGILAAFIHFVIDVSHTLLISSHMNELNASYYIQISRFKRFRNRYGKRRIDKHFTNDVK